MVFTLYYNELTDVFLQSIKKHGRPEKQPKNQILGSYFLISTTNSHKDLHKYFFTLEDNLIFCRKSPKHSEIAFMDIQNCFLIKEQVTIDS